MDWVLPAGFEAAVMFGVLAMALLFKPWLPLTHRPLQSPWLACVALFRLATQFAPDQAKMPTATMVSVAQLFKARSITPITCSPSGLPSNSWVIRSRTASSRSGRNTVSTMPSIEKPNISTGTTDRIEK